MVNQFLEAERSASFFISIKEKRYGAEEKDRHLSGNEKLTTKITLLFAQVNKRKKDEGG